MMDPKIIIVPCSILKTGQKMTGFGSIYLLKNATAHLFQTPKAMEVSQLF